MSRRKSYDIPGHAHFLTFSCFQQQPFLSEQSACEILSRSLDEARIIEQFDIWAYVFMPEHVHLLIRPRNSVYKVSGILRRIKEPAARQILELWRQIAKDRLVDTADVTRAPVAHRFWQPGGGFDRNLIDPVAIRKAIEYIEWNPVRRGLADTPLKWKWSSARPREGHTDVLLITNPVMFELSVEDNCDGTH